MTHIHHVNLQPIVGGGEIYTLALTRALLDAGARVTLYARPDVTLWDALAAPNLEIVRLADEAALLARLPAGRAVVLTQSTVSVPGLNRIGSRHRLAGFAHMPMLG